MSGLGRASARAYLKLGLALALDLLDLAAARVLGFGMVSDVVLAGVAYVVFGAKGLVQLWEVADQRDVVDGFVPTLTLLALWELRAEGATGRPPAKKRKRGVRA